MGDEKKRLLCYGCWRERDEELFHQRTSKTDGRGRRAYRCIDCRRQESTRAKQDAAYIAERYGSVRCAGCGKGKSVVADGMCKKCLRERGLMWCRRCREVKNVIQGEAFPRRAVCKACNPTAGMRKGTLERRNSVLVELYGVTLEDYDRMLREQDGRCAICRQPSEGRALAVDHCHRTKKVRGLLCLKCNLGLGSFGDDPARLVAAITYLARARVAPSGSPPAA